ncbi:hypothetical protein OUZ56_028516 [Daphnia magna]|uniref:C2H2-type domain-containing protein n=1 Tax=Daphnia magna TaxID=35525 RepID=A0ABR0B439_9CRUS|nr:hypothetical protein OUZ56_028516 [Daphnia magna]
MDFVFAESYSSEAWTQPAIESEILKRIRQICDDIRVLQERKLNLSCTALQPVGILAQWLFKKYNISGNNLMGDTISSVWQGISEEARLQLYCESLRQNEKVNQQATQIEMDADKLRVELKCLTEKLHPREKDKSVCQYFKGDIIQGQKMEYFCMEAGCGKSYKSRDSFYHHRSRNHPWMMMPSMSDAAITIASHVVLPAVASSSVSVPTSVHTSVHPVSVSLPTGKPRIGLYKRPFPKDIVVSLSVGGAKLPRQMLDTRTETHNGFPSDVHYRANLAYRKKYDGRPAAKNVVSHQASHILNRGADYYWCSRKAIKKVGQSTASPADVREGDRSCYTGWIRPSATSDWRCLGTLKTRAGGALLTCLYSFIEDFRRDFCSAGQNRQASFSNGWVRKAGPPSSWCSLSTADFTASDAEWEAKETIDAGACTRGFYLSTGGDVCSSVDVGCRIDCSHIRRRPPILPLP